jgi:uncharacterized integral membrane protein
MANKDEASSLDRSGPNPTLILGVVLAFAALDFIVQNRRPVDIDFLFFTFHARVWVALVITSVLAIVAAELMSHHLRRRRH